MSLSKTVAKAVEEVIHTFINQLSDKYNIDSKELLELWDSDSCCKVVKNTSPKKSLITDISSIDDDIDSNDLLKYKKPELQALCRQKGVKCNGTKAQLIGFLLGKEPSIPMKLTPTNNESKKVTSKNTTDTPPVLKKLVAKVHSIAIIPNKFGNLEHPESSLVFNKQSKCIGKQNDDGKIDDLTPEDINICNKYKFDYILPENLDKKSKLDDVQVDELEEESEDDLDSDVEEVEEVEEIEDEEDEEIVEDELIENVEEEEFEEEEFEEEEEEFEE